MKLLSGLLLSGAIALGSIGAAMAADGPARPAQGGPPGDMRQGGPGAPRAPASLGGTVGVVDSVSASGFEVLTSLDRKATVETSAATTYRQGSNAASASAVKKGERVLVTGLITVGRGDVGSNIKANQVTVRPAGLDKATKGEVGGVQGAAPVVKQVGKPVANYVQGEGTIIDGAEAVKAIEAGLAAWTGGYINRVVKLSTGEYEVHNVGVNWPHHIFVDKNFKYLGAQ